MYKTCIAVCYSFAILLLALFALIVSDSSFTPASNSGAFLLQDLTAIRIWIVIAGALVFAWKVNKKEPRGLTVTVLTVLAWIMFLEDFMVLDSILFVAEHPLARAVVITRPIFLAALSYVALQQCELDIA